MRLCDTCAGMGAVIAVGGQKGGTGKSTLAVNLTAQFVADGRPAALVDGDLQGTAARWGRAIGLPAVVSLPLETEREVPGWAGDVRALAAQYAILLIDCAPHIGISTQAAMAVADRVLLPVTPSAVDLRATGEALRLLEAVRAERAGKPDALLIPSRVDVRTASGRELPDALRKLGERVGPVIGQRSAWADCAAVDAWVGTYAPRSKAADELRALAKAALRGVA